MGSMGCVMVGQLENEVSEREEDKMVMCGVVLAGGLGTRLRPLTEKKNKHLLDVCGREMVRYPIEMLRGIGVEDVIVVTGEDCVEEFEATLGNEGVEIVGQKEPRGIADALLCAEVFVRGKGAKSMCVVLGDQLIGGSLKEAKGVFERKGGIGSVVVLKEVEDASRYGVAELVEGEVVNIEEKPREPRSGWAVTGMYFYDQKVFDYCREVGESARGEYEITDVNCKYIEAGQMKWCKLDGWWADVGTFGSLDYAREMVQRWGANEG